MTEALYLEDLQAGQTFESRPYLMTADEIKAFAHQYDPQPFHTDERTAVDTFFNGLAASGWHTAAVGMRLMVESIPIAGGLIGAGIEGLRWFQPVRPGDTLQLTSEILSLRASVSKPGQGIIKVRHTTQNQAGVTVQQCVSTVVVPRRPTEG